VEYCNSAGEGEYARLRRANGFEEPWHVPYWFLGNEIYGDWVPGTMTGEEYSRFAVEAAKLIKWVDPEVKLIGMATGTYLPDWDRASLEATVDIVDYVSLHMYPGGTTIMTAWAAPPSSSTALASCVGRLRRQPIRRICSNCR
jgi:alpha-N-arabinofuranosidase